MTEWVVTCVCVRKEKDMVNIYGYPGYPTEPRPPPAPSLRVTGRQQSQLETHAVHHTHTKTTAVSSLSVASDSSGQLEWTTGRADKSPFAAFLSIHLLCSFLLLLVLPLLCWPPAVWPGAFHHLPPKTWMTYLEWTLFCYPYSSLPACLPSYGGYFYSFVLRKREQIKFWAHQHFQGPTAAEWEGKHWNPITQLDTLLITGYDWYRL